MGATESPLRLLLEELRDHGVFMLSRTGRVLTWNNGAEAVHGYAAEEIIGQHYSILFPAESVATAEPDSQLESARARGGYQREGWQVRKDGSRFWANEVLTPLHDRLGRLRGFGVVTQVLTDRMRAQDLLAVLDAATDAVLGVDASGAIMFINDAAATMFGYAKSELVGCSIETLVPRRYRMAHPARRAGYGRHPVPRAMGGGLDLTAVRRDGSEFPAEVSLSSVQTPRGPVVTALVRDMSEHHAAEAARRMADERLRVLFENSPAGQAEATMDALLVRVNSTLARMLGYPEGAPVGGTWWDLVHPGERGRLMPEIEALIRGEATHYVAGLQLISRNREPVPALVSASVLRDRHGHPQRLVVVAIDQRQTTSRGSTPDTPPDSRTDSRTDSPTRSSARGLSLGDVEVGDADDAVG